MTKISAIYDSPVGSLLIEAMDDAITALLFKEEKDIRQLTSNATANNKLINNCIQQLN
jgi:hypothetical protein